MHYLDLGESFQSNSNAYFLAKFGFDTAENEPSEVCRIPPRLRAADRPPGPPESLRGRGLDVRGAQGRAHDGDRGAAGCPAPGDLISYFPSLLKSSDQLVVSKKRFPLSQMYFWIVISAFSDVSIE